jgi:hypothetical protein
MPPSRGSNPTVDLSVNDADVELLPLRRSRVRSFFAKFVFLTIFCAALLLLSFEVSSVYHVAWLDPRPLLAKAKVVARATGLEKLFEVKK